MPEFAPVKFHFFDFIFTPYKKNIGSSSKEILKQCIQRINDERVKKQNAIVIDRHETRDETESRNLFVSSAAFLIKDNIYKCRIALLRDNKIPTLVNKSDYNLTSLDYLKGKSIAETTNFYIDVSGKNPVVCCEFNNMGPRISDIEYYFRYISSSKMLNISKACKASVHMEVPVDHVLQSISDVFRFKIKTKPNRLSHLYQDVGDAFITNMSALANTVKPASIKVDLFFRERGGKEIIGKNREAVSFTKKILNAVKNDSKVIDDFDDFYLEFENEDGTDGVFNLIKGKREIEIHCPYKSPGHLDTKVLYELTKEKISSYLNKE